MNKKIKIGKYYQHFKGSIMKVTGIALNSETLEEMVLYEHNNKLWARPISSFLDTEDVSNRADNVTKQKYRFILIDNNKINEKEKK